MTIRFLVSAALLLAPAPLLAASSGNGPRIAPSPAESASEVYKMKLGSFTVVAVGDGIFELPTDQLLIDKKPGEVAALLAADHQPVVQPTSVNAYLIDTGTKKILIDTGSGSFFGPTLGKVLAGLKSAGYKPEDISEILITHLHPDHVGGLSVDGRMAFPNATVRLEEAEQAFWLDKANSDKVDPSVKGSFDAAAVSLAPYIAAGRVRAFKPGAVLEPGITAVALPGHTPGHSAYRIESAGKSLLILGDVFHVAAVQLVDPAITIKFDYSPDQAFASRMRILRDAATRHTLVAGAHLKFPGIGTFRKGAGQWQWVPVTDAPAAR